MNLLCVWLQYIMLHLCCPPSLGSILCFIYEANLNLACAVYYFTFMLPTLPLQYIMLNLCCPPSFGCIFCYINVAILFLLVYVSYYVTFMLPSFPRSILYYIYIAPFPWQYIVPHLCCPTCCEVRVHFCSHPSIDLYII